MRVILFLFAFSSLSAFELKIATYNVENLFDLTQSGHEYKQYSPSYENWNIASYQTKLENISSVIGSLNPDIIALQEIENESVLKSLMERCNAKGTHFSSLAFGELPHSPSVGVSILSRYPIIKVKRHHIKIPDNKQTRMILESEIKTPHGMLRCIAVHWPSKGHKESFRIRAAQVVRKIIDTLPADCEYLIFGDFNSNFDEMSALLTDNQDDSRGVTGINHILKTTNSPVGKSFIPFTPNEIRTFGKGFHYNPWVEKVGTEQFSYRHKGNFNTIDHILLPASLLDSKRFRYKTGSFGQFTLYGALLDNYTPIRWQTQYTKKGMIHLNRGWSDHIPVSLILSTEGPMPSGKGYSAGSFEHSHDGWIVQNSKVMAIRTNEQSAEGEWSLKLSGMDSKNGTAARLTAIIPPNKVMDKLQIAGEGDYGIRIQKANSAKWLYLKGTTYSGSAANTFATLPEKKWVQRNFSLSPFKVGDTVNLEIRYRGNKRFRLFIDDVSLNGWFRSPGK